MSTSKTVFMVWSLGTHNLIEKKNHNSFGGILLATNRFNTKNS